jgi:hypothetical protein
MRYYDRSTSTQGIRWRRSRRRVSTLRIDQHMEQKEAHFLPEESEVSVGQPTVDGAAVLRHLRRSLRLIPLIVLFCLWLVTGVSDAIWTSHRHLPEMAQRVSHLLASG